MLPLLYILWDFNPVIFNLGSLEPRWYGVLFAAGFFVGQILITKIFVGEGKPEKDVEALTLYMMVATVLGARLGHCLFYEPEYYLSHPLEILKVWKGGLASHGATIGIITAMWFYSRNRPGQSFLWILDRIVIVVALGGAFIRLGNLANSEIIGRPTNVPWAFLFVRPVHEAALAADPKNITDVYLTQTGQRLKTDGGDDDLAVVKLEAELEKPVSAAEGEQLATMQIPYNVRFSDEALEQVDLAEAPLNPKVEAKKVSLELAVLPRHPAQLYEALSNFALFVFLWLLWSRLKQRTPEGLFFGLFVVILFTLRFFYEFIKENQVEFEDALSFNMGQLLSIPMVIFGIIILYLALTRKKTISA